MIINAKIAMGLAFAGVIAAGVLAHLERRKLAGLILFLALASCAPSIMWPTLMELRKDSRALRRVPLAALERGCFTLSVPLGLLLGLVAAFRTGERNGRKRQWDAPRSAGDTDKALARILDGEPAKDETLLGAANGGVCVAVTDKEREAHMQIVGPSGAGKSQLLFALSAQDMKRGMPVFFMEAKGDSSDFDQFLKLAEKAGRRADVRYFNPQDPRSMTFNPIRRLPGQDVTAVTNQLARAIGREPTSTGEGQDYYRSLDYARMLHMIEVFCATGREFTLKDCLHYFSAEKARQKAFDLCKDSRVVDAAWADFKQSTDTTALTSALAPWTTGELGRLLNSYSPDIRLEDVFDERQLAYMAVPVGHLQMLANPLGRMMISGLLSVAAARQKQQPKPPAASVILDEFAEFATPVFASFIATVRSARFWTILSHQDLGQLKRIEGMSPEAFRSAVFANTSGCKVCFRTPDPEDAKFWAATLGTFTTHKDTEQMTKGWAGASRTGVVSRRAGEEFKVHPNLLKNLTPGTALIYSAGRLECLAKTAQVARLLERVPTPGLEAPHASGGVGLDLEAALASAEQYDKEGRIIARR